MVSEMWTKIISWHIVDMVRKPDNWTLCGKKFTGDMKEEPVLKEQTCESCFRRKERLS